VEIVDAERLREENRVLRAYNGKGHDAILELARLRELRGEEGAGS